MSDSSQGSGTPKPSAAKAPPVPPRGVNAPIRPKAPALGVRPLAQSSHDHSVPEARRAREPLPEDATVPMRRSDRPPSMPAEDGWTAGSADITAQVPRDAPSPKPAAVAAGGNASVVTDASALRAALQEVLEPMQHALDDLTVKIARERVDRKEAIERLERTVARVATANPPPVAPAAATVAAAAPAAAPPAPKAPPVQNTPFAAATNFAPITSPFAATNAPVPAREAPAPAAPQPYSVSPSAAPPPVAPVAAVATASPVPAPKPASPAPPPVAAAAPIAVHVPPVVTPSTIPVKIDFDYSTDLNFELPPGLDMGKRRRRMAWFVFIIIIGGAIAMLVSTLISQSRGPGAL